MSTNLDNSMWSNSVTFESIFLGADNSFGIRVPDYQRAFTWEQKQIDLFIQDLARYQGRSSEYYFGHFIAEKVNGYWDIVDGQQRLTTFMLFLMVCKTFLLASTENKAYSFIDRFSTVSYDNEALKTMGAKLNTFLTAPENNLESDKLTDKQIISNLALKEQNYTLSQRRMVLALHRFYRAFNVKNKLCSKNIDNYINVIMSAQCSLHLTASKSVAVNIFEMQNTRGIPLTTLDIVKAKLMRFVYENGVDNKDKDEKVETIRKSFGNIYKMEELVALSSFRGDLSMENLLRLHLRAVDDGNKKQAKQFNSPAINANPDGIIGYVDSMLYYQDSEKKSSKDSAEGLKYAVNLAKEFEQSVRIACEILPAWDKEDTLVGDVLILERDISYQFFFIVCRLLERRKDKADKRLEKNTLLLWEKLLFTRDFHTGYYNLKSDRDNFPALFAGLFTSTVEEVIKRYLKDGFRPQDRTQKLQQKVLQHLEYYKDDILKNAFVWWKQKMIYAIYKYEINKNAYEISKKANIRSVMKGTISVEHILPQGWQMDWIDEASNSAKPLSEEEKSKLRKEVDAYINGLGNLLLITPGDNTSVLNNHPKDKRYPDYGRSYTEHNEHPENWESSAKWRELIYKRGNDIYDFMVTNLIDKSDTSPDTTTDIPMSNPI